jgi:hypothetical protein
MDDSFPPAIDNRIKFIGTSSLRLHTVESLRDLGDLILVIQDGSGNRLAVLTGYDTFMALQARAMGK